jgi:hypothetical protein
MYKRRVDRKREFSGNDVMQWFAILSPELFLCLGLLMPAQHHYQACLPEGIKLTDIVSTQLINSATGTVVRKLTVKQKLKELSAHCLKGKLVDRSGKRVYFYRLVGCWGNPPFNYLEILDRQREEIEKLKRQYTVIEITCNPDGITPH